jgi:CBS domain containing-hemolysin-like protein
VLNALFVVAEFSLVAADRGALDRAAAAGDRRAGRAAVLLDRLSFHLSGTQMGITVTSVLLGFLAEPAVAAVLDPVLSDPPRAVSVALALVVATVFQMVLGELVPKQVAIAYADRSVRILAGPIRAYSAVAGPAIAHFEGVANRVIRLFGIEPREHLAAGRSREELEWLLRASGEGGELEPDEVSLLTRSIRFGEKTAADALTPRTSIVAVADTDPVSRFVEVALESGYSRLPVFHDDLDDIVGVVHVKSVFGLDPADRGTTPVRSIMTGVLAVPESRDLDELFADFRNSRTYLAVVVDEHGGTAGILTLEDLLEELVGEINDEFDLEDPDVVSLGGGAMRVLGRMSIAELSDQLGTDLPDDDWDTVGGLIFNSLGHVPTVGEEIDVCGFRFRVDRMQGRRIMRVRIAPSPEPTADAGGDPLDTAADAGRSTGAFTGPANGERRS